jgi:uncharacterized protein
MADRTSVKDRPAWIDLSSADPAASRAFYAGLFGWNVEVSPDPQYGGYAVAKIDGKDVAGIGPTMATDAPTAWMVYIGTEDIDALGARVSAAGGSVVAPPFAVGEQGRMAVFQDPSGAFISAWQPIAMGGFQTQGPNAFSWPELSARGLQKDLPFYESVFGWTAHTSQGGDGAPAYTEFELDGVRIAGAQEMQPMVPASVPSYWLVYFGSEDVDATFQKAIGLGAREMLPPMDFPGGRLAIVADPHGAAFGLLKLAG